MVLHHYRVGVKKALDDVGGGAGVVCHAMKDEDLRAFYQTPWVMVGSDGGIGMRHPRGSGTVANLKMTSLPAQTLKLKDRGVIPQGAFADLVLFNPDTVIDRSTFADPLTLSTGIEKVF